MLKKSLIVLSSILVIIIAFLGYVIYWGSQPTMDKANYHGINNYGPDWQDQTDTLSIMTYNIGYMSGMTNNRSVETNYSLFDANLEKAISLIDIYHPNIIGFQEIDFVSQRSFYQNQMDSIALRSEYAWGYRSINWDKRYVPFPYWPTRNQFGNVLSGQAVLSDFQFFEVQTLTLQRPDLPFYYDPFYLDRLVQVTDIAVGDKILKVMNVHLEAFDKEARLLQAAKVKFFYDLYADRFPLLLIGDFNSLPPGEGEKDAMDIIMEGKHIRSAIDLEDYERSKSSYYTYSSEEPKRMIDYILYNSNFIEKVESKVVGEAREISDHLPVYFKFYVSRQIEFFKGF